MRASIEQNLINMKPECCHILPNMSRYPSPSRFFNIIAIAFNRVSTSLSSFTTLRTKLAARSS